MIFVVTFGCGIGDWDGGRIGDLNCGLGLGIWIGNLGLEIGNRAWGLGTRDWRFGFGMGFGIGNWNWGLG